ncbi:cation diffusion facilitator family transporter [Ketogulonicigenium vulgare]|uniref:Cation diffusion facilitator family transporter n=1 Tax=Ketogulonicigenium vulgare (strain WSH-001) TaxID=759362 RepID=F9Y5H9_KETVW|nr:cation transporter [Ketogulonicigenium vulgare]ADO42536.1 cation diffusion facilitator family transporter [Ketogulonicigenium vulgare Y25]AEM40732.1 Cation diffusion facilitator family transporter [Ketogulonicigenium vulgare WSH-001]ALJ80901.1 cation diffusion facilitator family transporter [Ketogulonicigenium vulgare]ANW33673.1 cation diffusion facilitator family transporter [Ketogulonicigenium vulgare]AOZ54449.1 cation diffusion facilitator family transporter [Ketogulonicigenium vulgare]
MTEEVILRRSIIATFIIAAYGVTLGLWSGSAAVIFDSAYSLIDASMTVLSLVVASLILRSAAPDGLSHRLRSRFSMGFWHLEPIVLALNGMMLIIISAYGLMNAIISIGHGGREPDFGIGLIYAVTTLFVYFGMMAWETRHNRRIKSELIALDIRSWLMGGSITAALLVSFVIALILQRTEHAWMVPYVDPVILAVISLGLMPLPIPIVRQAFSEIFLMTPMELKADVDAICERAVAQHGFLDYRAYVAKIGRGLQIEIYFIVAPDTPTQSITAWDALRNDIATQIGQPGPDRWLTIVFTADHAWAE